MLADSGYSKWCVRVLKFDLQKDFTKFIALHFFKVVVMWSLHELNVKVN